jgi:hypothetical protein
MSSTGLPLGWDHNFIHEASGKHIPLKDVGGIMFYNYLAAGTQTLTLKESKSSAGASEQNLVVMDVLWKAPGTGGTWTKISQTASATYDHSTDSTNDLVGVYVSAESLSDEFTHLEMTSGTGTCIAVLGGLSVQRDPANLASNI